MEIRIFGMKFRVEILILIIVVYWILFGHTFCGCSNVGLMEGLAMMKNNGVKNNGMPNRMPIKRPPMYKK